jgi:sortase A
MTGTSWKAELPPLSRARLAVRTIGEVLITLGVIVFLFIAYELWFTGIYTARQQSDLKRQLAARWATPVASAPASPTPGASILPGESPPATPSPQPPAQATVVLSGDAIGIIRIPRLGAGYGFAIVEGVSTDDLKKGPGHYPGSAMPGGIGNFVLSGHRTTYLAPFSGLGELGVGDPIVIETATTYYTYRVTTIQVVLPTHVGVVLPVPDQPAVRPTKALITLTTCEPKYSASHRLVVDGLLESALPKSAGLPPALAGR